MPLFTGSTHTQINGGNFYDVSGDVNIENNPHLTVQDVQLQVVPQAPPLLIQLPAPFDHSATPRPLPPLALCPDPTPTYTLPNLRDTSADSHAIEHSSSCHEPARAYEYGAENQSFGYVHVPGQQGISVGMSSLFALDHTHYEPSTTIHGGTFVSGNVNNIRRQGEIGLHILYRAVSGDAFHNSAERFPQPKCHPETRTEMLQELQNWSAQTDSSSSILWLNGPAGSGKSAIAQTFAQQLDATGRLGASFFFQRGHSSRGTARKLFPTIAYQLATLLPEYKLLVSQQVEKEPSIVDRSLSIQLQSLILGPIQHAAYSDAPQILIIDGLDECDDQTVQREILRLLGDSVRNHSTPIRICIASRPEPHIREIFDGLCLDGLCRSFNVEKSFEDVRKYLWHEFARIHREHGDTMNTISAPWPMVAVVDRLVNKSSGYFIYASTIIKFVDDKNFRPTERLDRIEKLDGTEFDSPFGALDQLYTQILTNVPRRPDLLLILHVVVHFRLHPRHIEQLLQLNPGDVRLTLRGLTSVLQVPSEQLQSPVKMHHASFGDFLNDATRSAKFYIGASQNHMDLARTVLKAIPYVHDNLVINRTGHVAWSLAFHGIHYIASTIPPLIDLLPLVRFINPDFLFFSVSSKNAAEHFLLWLKKMRPLPVDLIQLWEDYHFMSVFDAILKQNSQRPYLQLLTVPATIEDFLSQPRQLIRILYGMVLSHSFPMRAVCASSTSMCYWISLGTFSGRLFVPCARDGCKWLN
ncbi:hypothetical protein B0H10DRAFT_50618 [Mycena sp. CBHHK59/15]|nr:hypothetical protein B0H10DRAFT_50618 [Mycena sp. CBHHK59/15]